MIHYHGTPITPVAVLMTLAGRNFCVSYARPDDVVRVHQIAQSVMLDNGAFSLRNSQGDTEWAGYYTWADQWLRFPTSWAVVPDIIDGEVERQDALLAQWPHGHRGAPVWHMNEPIDRLLRLLDGWPRVCIGSTAKYWQVLSPAWCRRMDAVWNAIAKRHRRLPWVHQLRGMQLSGREWPFASVDSADVGRNHRSVQKGSLLRPENTALLMASRWDARQTPASWQPKRTFL